MASRVPMLNIRSLWSIYQRHDICEYVKDTGFCVYIRLTDFVYMWKDRTEETDNHCRLPIMDIDFCVYFRDPEISVFVGGRKQGKKKGGNPFGLSILDTGLCMLVPTLSSSMLSVFLEPSVCV